MEFGDEHANAYVLNDHRSIQADAQNKCWLIVNAKTMPVHPTVTGQCESMLALDDPDTCKMMVNSNTRGSCCV